MERSAPYSPFLSPSLAKEGASDSFILPTDMVIAKPGVKVSKCKT